MNYPVILSSLDNPAVGVVGKYPFNWGKKIGLHTNSYPLFFTIVCSHSYSIFDYCKSFLASPFD